MSEDAIQYVNEKDWLTKAIQQIRDEIAIEVDPTNFPEIQEKIQRLTVMSGTAAQAMSVAKKILLQRQQELINSLPKITPLLQNKWLQGQLFHEESQLTYCDRLTASISHSIDGLRSILSFAKAEMEAAIHAK